MCQNDLLCFAVTTTATTVGKTWGRKRPDSRGRAVVGMHRIQVVLLVPPRLTDLVNKERH